MIDVSKMSRESLEAKLTEALEFTNKCFEERNVAYHKYYTSAAEVRELQKKVVELAQKLEKPLVYDSGICLN